MFAPEVVGNLLCALSQNDYFISFERRKIELIRYLVGSSHGDGASGTVNRSTYFIRTSHAWRARATSIEKTFTIPLQPSSVVSHQQPDKNGSRFQLFLFSRFVLKRRRWRRRKPNETNESRCGNAANAYLTLTEVGWNKKQKGAGIRRRMWMKSKNKMAEKLLHPNWAENALTPTQFCGGPKNHCQSNANCTIYAAKNECRTSKKWNQSTDHPTSATTIKRNISLFCEKEKLRFIIWTCSWHVNDARSAISRLHTSIDHIDRSTFPLLNHRARALARR